MKSYKKPKKQDNFNLFVRIVRRILITFKTRPTIILSDQILPDQAIYIANHSGAAGPLTISMYFPNHLVPWGAHPMTEHYFKRWQYLYHVFYRQKLKYSRIRSWILATLFGIISKALYKGVQLIPTYTDLRLMKTMKLSIDHLKIGNSLLIFPEDSEDGYHEHIKDFHAGFIYLAEKYAKETSNHIPIVPLFYHKALNEIRVGKAYTLDDFSRIKKRKDKAIEFKTILNQLGKTKSISSTYKQ
jgi:1-acyl-sn-glycerol-3-phosphate acyltransferase